MMDKRYFFFIFTFIWYSSLFSSEKPVIVILATGGTIAGQSQSSVDAQYQAAKVPVDDLLQAVPEIHELAQIRGIQACQIASQDMTNQLWLSIARQTMAVLRREDVTGVVITHGTDTMEETAYFLNLVLTSGKPVVLTGAMRPPGSLSADGAMNLYNAVSLAISPKAREKGVLVLFNDQIHAAREVTKANTIRVNAFKSPNFGVLGYVHYGNVRFYRQSTRKHTLKSDFTIDEIDTLPAVAILYGHADFNAEMVEQVVKSGVTGIVFAGTGNGNPNAATTEALAQAVQKKIVVVRSSRTGSGPVTLQAEVDDAKYGFIVADNLTPQKSRILLMLALTQTRDQEQIQKIYFLY